MKLSYKRRVFLSFALIFVVFALAAIVIEQQRQKTLKREALATQLGGYISLVEHSALPHEGAIYDPSALQAISPILPPSIRLSLMREDGKMLYDNTIDDLEKLENHLMRPEIQSARAEGEGQDIRTSTSKGIAYFYLARKVGPYYLRVALPYDEHTQATLRADKVFVYWMIAFLLVMLALGAWVAGYLAKAIQRLRQLALQQTSSPEALADFPDDELGEISQQLVRNYQTLHNQAERITLERERLLQHILSLPEGIGFLDKHGEVILFNAPFLQYLSSLGGCVSAKPEELLQDETFASARHFIAEGEGNHYEEQIHKHGRIYQLTVNRFADGGSEMLLQDITEGEKMRTLKREMTSNISHELRTPVTSIRGYIETCLTSEGLPEEMQRHFLSQAHTQTLLLSELIRDIGLLSQIEEGDEHFVLETIHFADIRAQLLAEFGERIEAQRMRFTWLIDEEQTMRANRHLLYATFRNLLENSLRYAGEGVDFVVQLYRQDEHGSYFSVYDTGPGVEEQHLLRLFERFYRCTEGRTRDSGGTGLGLSIVKNAVRFHRGDISVKNRSPHGLEYLFRLSLL